MQNKINRIVKQTMYNFLIEYLWLKSDWDIRRSTFAEEQIIRFCSQFETAYTHAKYTNL